MNAQFNRPGVSNQFLTDAGCAHVGADECVKLYGFRAEGIAIPFRRADGSPAMHAGKPFARVRLYQATDEQKYHQRRDSGVHIYVPPTFAQSPKGSRLILVEGEFKALALSEAGFAALGLCGITGAAHTIAGTNGDREYALQAELAALLETHQPAHVVFLGDADVALNAQFAVEAAKLRRLLFTSRQFPFLQKLTVANLPVDGPKGVDDLRHEKGTAFNECFEQIISGACGVPPKATATEIFAALLRREKDVVKRLVSQPDHDGSRSKRRLLQSAAQLWHESGAVLDLKPLLAEVLSVRQSEVAGLVRDATDRMREREAGRMKPGDSVQGCALDLPDVEPWPDEVDGPTLLDQVATTFRRYCVLPDTAADALALWVAHAHCFECFQCSPRLHITSPEKRCGKTTARDVSALFAPRPLPTENLSVPVLFRVIEKAKPTLLADECDAWLRDNEELRGMLNAGHRRGGQALRCEGESNEIRAFSVFGPTVLCGIGALPGTLHDRSIVIRLERAKPGELQERLDSRRTERERELCRKLARFCADNTARLQRCDPVLPSGAFNRVADNWRPLFAIAEVAGGDWPRRAAEAFAKLTSNEDADAQGVGTMLLADIADIWARTGADKLPSAEIVKALAEIEGREWADWGRARKPISPNQLAKQLRHFNITPRTIKLSDGSTAKGYHRDMFNAAFERYLPQPPASNRNPVTMPENIGDSSLSETSPAMFGLRIAKATLANKDGGGYEVTVEETGKRETAELLL